MSNVRELGSTTSVFGPTWNGQGFVEAEAQAFWVELPSVLRRIALDELAAGNSVKEILRNKDRGIVLLSFTTGPRTTAPRAGIVVHTEHRYGNYCYDDTVCTFEDPTSGSFLAFARAGAV